MDVERERERAKKRKKKKGQVNTHTMQEHRSTTALKFEYGERFNQKLID